MIEVNYKLCGMYRFSVIKENQEVYTSNWTRNTILSSGLASLYSESIPNLLNILSFGGSSSLSGSSGYGLSGVILPTSYVNIPRQDFQIFTDASTPSLRTYYSSFSFFTSASQLSANEFAIMITPTRGFARNVLSETLFVPINSILNFEYRLQVDWSNTNNTTALFNNVSSNSFYLPLSVTTYNIPGDRLFYSNGQLIFNQYNQDLPTFGSDFWQNVPGWGIGTKANSSFTISSILTSANHITREFTTTTVYRNISAPVNSGFYDNINSFNIVLDGNTDIKTNSYIYGKFAYPLSLYNQTTVLSSTAYIERNNLDLTFRYTWSE